MVAALAGGTLKPHSTSNTTLQRTIAASLTMNEHMNEHPRLMSVLM